MKKLLSIGFFILFASLFLFSGCNNEGLSQIRQGVEMGKVIENCISLCNNAKNNINLSRGPCLSDIYAEQWQVSDWVCDVAHWPRQDIDNKAENQCQSYRQGKARHFVEVNESCGFIRVL